LASIVGDCVWTIFFLQIGERSAPFCQNSSRAAVARIDDFPSCVFGSIQIFTLPLMRVAQASTVRPEDSGLLLSAIFTIHLPQVSRPPQGRCRAVIPANAAVSLISVPDGTTTDLFKGRKITVQFISC